MSKKPETPPLYVRRMGNMLVPEFSSDAEQIMRMPIGQRIKIDIRTGRSPAKLRFYWQMLNKLIAATDCAANSEALHSVVKLDLGYANPVRLRNGMTVLVPGSVAFDKMTEQDFDDFLEKAIAWIATNYGVTPDQLMNGEAA